MINSTDATEDANQPVPLPLDGEERPSSPTNLSENKGVVKAAAVLAIMDWFSRFVVTWQLSNTRDGAFCLDALRQALRHSQPEIFNTDQGVQFPAHPYYSGIRSSRHTH